MPLRGLAHGLDLAADDSAGHSAPCHVENAADNQVPPLADADHGCCDDPSTGCSHCFMSMGVQLPVRVSATAQADALPVSSLPQLVTIPLENLFRPPRALL